jgi:hypothetical protein
MIFYVLEQTIGEAHERVLGVKCILVDTPIKLWEC